MKPSCKDILDSSNNGVIATDAKGWVTYINPQATTILGFKPHQILGRYIPDILPLIGPIVIECLQTGNKQIGHHIIGRSVKLVINVAAIHNGHRVAGAVCTFLEMREFENSAAKLASHQKLHIQLKAIFQSSSDGIWLCDGQGRVLDINRASEKLNGIQSARVVGKTVARLVQDGLFEESVTLEVIHTRRQVSILQKVKQTDKTLLLTGTPVFDDKGDIFLIVVNERDITQLNALKEKLDQTSMETEKIKDELVELSMLELKKQEIIAENREMRQVLRVALKLARLEASNILVLGESGTGKGLLAKFIHKNSRRAKMPFVQINCAALPENLLEAELFGYEKGAFTGAGEQGKAGLFELAHGGTLFLDEIGDLPMPLQAKLLKYLDDQEVMRLGALRSKRVDCTVIAATNVDLEQRVKKRGFRQDLFYRLNAFTIRIPPLRQRPEDVFELTTYFLKKDNETYGLNRKILHEGMDILQTYPFPGNVRELKNILKKAVVMSEQDVLDPFLARQLQGTGPAAGKPLGSGNLLDGLAQNLHTVEKELLKKAANQCRSTRQMAALLGISQPTVVRKLKKHGIASNRVGQ
jgi:PAS domain S-box-containing protein